MKALVPRKLALAAVWAGIAALGAAVIASQVGAVTGDLVVSSATVAPGQTGTITVTADTPSPGLGAWTVDVIVENPDAVEILDCDVPSHSVCNPDYPSASPTVRFAGAVATGLVGETEIGTISFRCADEEGSTVLALSTAGYADATIGGPQEVAVTHTFGMIRCTEEAEEPGEATATPGVGGLPPTGSAGPSDAGPFGVALAALAATGLAGVAGYTVLRLRGRRS